MHAAPVCCDARRLVCFRVSNNLTFLCRRWPVPFSSYSDAAMSKDASNFVEDFIAFDFSFDDDPVEPQASTVQNGCKKGLATSNPQMSTKGKKRTADEMQNDDSGYSKKQQIAADSRIAPWAENVDWDNCRNAADMSVLSVF